MKKALAGFLFIVSLGSLSAQTHRTLSIDLGGNFGYFKDQIFSPMNYQSKGLFLGLGYEKETKKDNLFGINIGGSTNELNAHSSPYLISSMENISLAVSYLWSVSKPEKSFQVYAGPALTSFTNLVNYDDYEALSFVGVHGLSAKIRIKFPLGKKGGLYSDLQVPVFVKRARPAYTGWNKFIAEHEDQILTILTSGDWTTIHELQGLKWTSSYYFHLSERKDLKFKYTLNYLRSDQMILATHQLGLGINFKK